MERERWKRLYAMALAKGKLPRSGTYFGVARIVGVFLWSVLHDRPVCWACRGENWPEDLRPSALPSQPTMSRRLRSAAVQELLRAMAEDSVHRTVPGWVKSIDSKPLPVGDHSKDHDATWGRSFSGRLRLKGYKFHAVWDSGPMPLAWEVTGMNVHDSRAAARLLPQLHAGGYVLADCQYDHNKLYDLAARHGHQLVAHRQHPQAGLGHHRHSPFRLRSIALQRTTFGRALMNQRNAIERQFGGLTSFGGGLAPLPSWVRNLPRVWLWLTAKLLINALRIRQNSQPTLLAPA